MLKVLIIDVDFGFNSNYKIYEKKLGNNLLFTRVIDFFEKL